MAAITSAANTGSTEMDLITQIVQAELLEQTVILGSVMDHSSLLIPGLKSVEIPRFEADTTPGSGRFGDPGTQNPDGETAAPFQTATLTTDVINLDQWKNLPYRIPDRVGMQSRVPLEAELARKAGKEFAIYMDDEIRGVLATLTATRAYADTVNETMQLEDITAVRRILNKENVPQDNRVLLISPEQEEAMLNISNFIKANEYGSREALLNGEIGRVFGFRVLVSNLLAASEAYAYHRECVGYAIQHQVDFETQRADVNIRATDYSYASGWGFTLMYDGRKGVKFVETA
jgi:hypothetical protein